jgi:hypothetical protein
VGNSACFAVSAVLLLISSVCTNMIVIDAASEKRSARQKGDAEIPVLEDAMRTGRAAVFPLALTVLATLVVSLTSST